MKYAPFLYSAFVWLGIGVGFCFLNAGDHNGPVSTLWMVTLWALSLTDLLCLSKAIAVVLGLISDNHSVNKPAQMIQVAYWGTLKMVCLGLFAILLAKSRAVPGIADQALVLGISTLIVVPLAGGLWWSQREFKHAS
jgi:hypothetical protein